MMPKKIKSVEGKASRTSSIQINRTRTSGKKNVDLFANLRNVEHPLDDIRPRGTESKIGTSLPEKSHLNATESYEANSLKTGITGISSTTGTTGTPSTPSNTSLSGTIALTTVSGTPGNFPTSPDRDFTKTPNSVTRVILAQGLFRGKSKQIYDYFWSVSRGAIKPVRVFRKTHNEIQRGSGIGSRNTIIDGIKHLEAIGLISKTSSVGVAGGNEYEIFTPDEKGYTGITDTTGTTGITGITGITGTSALTGYTGIYQNLVIPVQPDSGTTGITQISENKDSYEFPKTSLKTNTKNDDDTRVSEAFSVLEKRLDAAVKKLTGKGVSKYEAEKWGTLADLLILEMETAASRTDSISSVPAFLTEVLRRKLLGGNSPVIAKTSKSQPDTVGKPNESGEYEIKPLDEKGRSAAVEQLREFAADDFLPDFKKWYTAEDWEWLMKQLEIECV